MHVCCGQQLKYTLVTGACDINLSKETEPKPMSALVANLAICHALIAATLPVPINDIICAIDKTIMQMETLNYMLSCSSGLDGATFACTVAVHTVYQPDQPVRVT